MGFVKTIWHLNRCLRIFEIWRDFMKTPNSRGVSVNNSAQGHIVKLFVSTLKAADQTPHWP